MNEKLASWAGFIYVEPGRQERHDRFLSGVSPSYWCTPDGEYFGGSVPDFTNSLDACFKWLVPKLQETGKWIALEWDCETLRYEASVYQAISTCPQCGYHYNKDWWMALDEDPAIALCSAIEKLINIEIKNESESKKTI